MPADVLNRSLPRIFLRITRLCLLGGMESSAPDEPGTIPAVPGRGKEDLMPQYTLPDLRYDYSALEPHLSGKIMELHHDKHHAAYVKGANSALEKLDEAREKEDFTRLAALEKALAFNLSGHILHSLFWQNLAPKGGGRPSGELADGIKEHFSDFEKFKRQLTEVASTVMGSGWAALIWEPIGQRLLTTQIYDHQSNLSQGGVPILVLDAWEHAYYLQYQNRKTEFFEAIWNTWDWEDVSQRFEAVRGIDVGVVGAAR
jgi:Fe-Mn family superoxide dismutase